MPDLRTAAQELLDAASKITLAPYRNHDDLTATSRFEKARKTLEELLTGQQDSGMVIAAKDVDGPMAPEWALGQQDPAIEEAISLLRELARELRGHYSPEVKELPPQLAAVGSVCSDLERLRVLTQHGEPDEPTLFEAWDAGWKRLLFEDWRADWRAARGNQTKET